MADAKRWVAIGAMISVDWGAGDGVYILAADHDRIVASLQGAVSATNEECKDWAREYELRMKVTAERNQLAERCKELEAQIDGIAGDDALAEERCDNLSAENESLRKENERLAKLIEDNAEAVTLRAEIERLRKDAERYRWLRRPESGNALFTLTGSGECGPNMDSAIDSAMAAKDGA